LSEREDHGKPKGRHRKSQGHRPKPREHSPKPHAAPAPAVQPPKSNLERVFGTHSVRAVLLTRPKAVRRMLIAGDDEDYHRELVDLARGKGVEIEFIGWPEFLKLGAFTREEKHQGIFIFAEPRRQYGESDFALLEDASVVIALDQVSNPQNFATIIRTAAFFGADGIMILRNRSVEVSSEVVRYAVGGVEFVKIFRVVNLSQSLDALREMGFAVVGLDERGERTLAQTPFGRKIVLVIGAEGEGLRQKTKSYCDELVRIPGGRSGVESLNAGVATAVALAEIFRGPSTV
jgi:23S rRNA (guanosine2251-2'-O)-methyltransferase